MKDRLKVLLSAYACEPGAGSEPGVGWNLARSLAAENDVWVLTRANNQPVIDEALAAEPVPGLHFAYHDLPDWAKFWKRGQRGVQLYYYLWQRTALRTAAALHERVGFDIGHHVTFVRYWSPSFLAEMNLPYVWGPVGGGESAPAPFWEAFSTAGRRYEHLRDAARRLGELDPSVRRTARRASLVLTTTEQSAERLRRLGATDVRCYGESGLSPAEIDDLARLPAAPEQPVRFLSMGRLLHWKGYHLSVRAFAEARLPDAEYWLLGDGPEKARLEALAADLGAADRIRFLGRLPRAEALEHLGRSRALVHPSLHDSGGWVCLEAMAAGRPVACLDLGGPATQVTDRTGFRVAAARPDESVDGLARAMRRLAGDEALARRMGAAGRAHVRARYAWSVKAAEHAGRYREILDRSVTPTRVAA